MSLIEELVEYRDNLLDKNTRIKFIAQYNSVILIKFIEKSFFQSLNNNYQDNYFETKNISIIDDKKLENDIFLINMPSRIEGIIYDGGSINRFLISESIIKELSNERGITITDKPFKKIKNFNFSIEIPSITEEKKNELKKIRVKRGIFGTNK